MMRKYASKRRSEPVRFELDGVEFAASGGVSMLDLSELARMADVDIDSPQGFAALADFFSGALGKAEYDRFRKHIREHGTDPETLIAIMEGLVEEAVSLPTERPSPSSTGPTATGPTYRVVSPSQGRVIDMPLTPEREAELRAAVTRAQDERARATG